MNNEAILSEAWRLLVRKQYAEVVSKLSPMVFLFRNSADYYRFLGIASLETGDMSGAYSYFRRGEDLLPDNMDILFGLAVVHLARKEEAQAVSIWLRILEKDPKNATAQQALSMLRDAPEGIDWNAMIVRGELKKFHPVVKGFVLPETATLKKIGFIALAVVAVIVITLAIILHKPADPRPVPGVSSNLFDLASHDTPDYSGNTVYVLSPDEIKQSVGDIQSSFREYRDNKTRRMINRVMHSNASIGLKAQLTTMAKSLRKPDFTDFKDNAEFKEVIADPLIYEGSYVEWSGRVSNLRNDPDAIRFDFLVGYETNKIVEGQIPVSIPFAVDLHGGDAIELIGEVLLDKTNKLQPSLEVSAIRQIQKAR